ncbi:hypothetical protein RHGRI_004975 [Rhododendron griersonianum]|uniref:Uncharacterized protein n=1 Tax=Rhododendron griersonianum TaxID=479676 RepID=A0AAV6LAK9_9ERIC|nr:hypothetical protein RHGRI_004975 [Rhododendron griersonianum]
MDQFHRFSPPRGPIPQRPWVFNFAEITPSSLLVGTIHRKADTRRKWWCSLRIHGKHTDFVAVPTDSSGGSLKTLIGCTDRRSGPRLLSWGTRRRMVPDELSFPSWSCTGSATAVDLNCRRWLAGHAGWAAIIPKFGA